MDQNEEIRECNQFHLNDCLYTSKYQPYDVRKSDTELDCHAHCQGVIGNSKSSNRLWIMDFGRGLFLAEMPLKLLFFHS